MSKKLLVTRMPYKETLLNASVLTEHERIVEIYLQKPDQELSLGDIYLAKVERVAQDLNAAFVRINPDQMAFLPLKDCVAPIYKNPSRTGIPKAGDELLVQISREALKEKLPAVTTSLSFTGKYIVLTTGDTRLGLSSKLDSAKKRELRPVLEELKNEQVGMIARTEAGHASVEQLKTEYSILSKQCDKIRKYGVTRTCFSCVKKAAPQWQNLLERCNPSRLDEVVTDLPQEAEQIAEYLRGYYRDEELKVRLYQDPLLPLYKLYRLEKALDDAMKTKVWLRSGGYLMIEQTEAFTSIDVNTGKCEMKGNAEQLYHKINLEAAREIAYQLRLRQLSGIILVDFINQKQLADQEKLLEMLSGFLKEDSSPAILVDITKLQIVEITRKKTKKSLREVLTDLEKT